MNHKPAAHQAAKPPGTCDFPKSKNQAYTYDIRRSLLPFVFPMSSIMIDDHKYPYRPFPYPVFFFPLLPFISILGAVLPSTLFVMDFVLTKPLTCTHILGTGRDEHIHTPG